MNELFYKLTKSNVNNYCKRYSWEFVSNFITNNTAKIQLIALGRTFLLASGAIVCAISLRYAGS